VRDLANIAVDAALKAGQFKKRERADVTLVLPAGDPARPVLASHAGDALEFLMVARISVVDGDAAAASVAETTHPECPRCRRSLPLEGGDVCARCRDALGSPG
jgi:hypothetical protein